MLDRLTLVRPRPARALLLPSGAVARRLATLAPAGVALGIALSTRPAAANLTLLLLCVLVPVVEWLALPNDAIRRAETATFVLIVAAAAVHGAAGAATIGLGALALGDWLRPAAWRAPFVERAGLLLALVLAGVGVSGAPNPATASVLMLLWLAFIGFWMFQRPVGASRSPYLAMLAWVSLLLLMPLWMPLWPATAQSALVPGVPALRFALGFMTLDTLVVTTLGLGLQGRRGVSFWRRELPPTFARYNAMALAGASVVALYVAFSTPGLLSAVALLLTLQLALRDRERGRQRLVATICALSSALDARDAYTKGHSDRVAAYTIAIAGRLGWGAQHRRELEIAAHLHDVGKIGIPDAVLLHPGRLSAEQFVSIQTHVQLSADIARNVPELQGVARIIAQHHERLDGSGYPRGVAGDGLLPAARILAVADTFDAMTSTRTYRPAMPHAAALDELRRLAGQQFDADAVAALCQLDDDDTLEGALQFGYCLTH